MRIKLANLISTWFGAGYSPAAARIGCPTRACPQQRARLVFLTQSHGETQNSKRWLPAGGLLQQIVKKRRKLIAESGALPLRGLRHLRVLTFCLVFFSVSLCLCGEF